MEMRYHAPSVPVDLSMKDDSLNLPTLHSNHSMDERSVISGASSASAREAQANINTGLRQRKGKSKFADIVSMVMARNKNE